MTEGGGACPFAGNGREFDGVSRIPGFLLALGVLGRCLYWMSRGLGRSRLVAGAFGAVAAMGAHSLVDFNLYIPANALVLAWILGMATAPALTEEQRATSE